jgi:hypothetical protein
MYSAPLTSGSSVTAADAAVAVKAAALPNHLHEPSLRPFAPLSEQLTKSGQPRRRRRRLDVHEISAAPNGLSSSLAPPTATPSTSSTETLSSTSTTTLSSADPRSILFNPPLSSDSQAPAFATPSTSTNGNIVDNMALSLPLSSSATAATNGVALIGLGGLSNGMTSGTMPFSMLLDPRASDPSIEWISPQQRAADVAAKLRADKRAAREAAKLLKKQAHESTERQRAERLESIRRAKVNEYAHNNNNMMIPQATTLLPSTSRSVATNDTGNSIGHHDRGNGIPSVNTDLIMTAALAGATAAAKRVASQSTRILSSRHNGHDNNNNGDDDDDLSVNKNIASMAVRVSSRAIRPSMKSQSAIDIAIAASIAHAIIPSTLAAPVAVGKKKQKAHLASNKTQTPITSDTLETLSLSPSSKLKRRVSKGKVKKGDDDDDQRIPNGGSTSHGHNNGSNGKRSKKPSSKVLEAIANYSDHTHKQKHVKDGDDHDDTISISTSNKNVTPRPAREQNSSNGAKGRPKMKITPTVPSAILPLPTLPSHPPPPAPTVAIGVVAGNSKASQSSNGSDHSPVKPMKHENETDLPLTANRTNRAKIPSRVIREIASSSR